MRGMPLISPEVEVVEAVFAAGKGQDDGIHRCLFDKFRVVISAGMCAVAAADEENVSDRAGFDCFDKLRGAGEDGSVSKAGRQHVPAVDAAHALVAFTSRQGAGACRMTGEKSLCPCSSASI